MPASNGAAARILAAVAAAIAEEGIAETLTAAPTIMEKPKLAKHHSDPLCGQKNSRDAPQRIPTVF